MAATPATTKLMIQRFFIFSLRLLKSNRICLGVDASDTTLPVMCEESLKIFKFAYNYVLELPERGVYPCNPAPQWQRCQHRIDGDIDKGITLTPSSG
jgi:hypothetical protein